MTDQRQGVLIRQLQGLLGGNRFSDVRRASATFAAGVNTMLVDDTGIDSAVGVIIVEVDPVSHWSFNYFPRAGDIVVNNLGASQTIAFSYVVIG